MKFVGKTNLEVVLRLEAHGFLEWWAAQAVVESEDKDIWQRFVVCKRSARVDRPFVCEWFQAMDHNLSDIGRVGVREWRYSVGEFEVYDLENDRRFMKNS